MSGSPIHPATVHFPFAFLAASSLLDILTFASLKVPSVLSPLISILNSSSSGKGANYNFLTLIEHLSALSYLSLVLGLISAGPAIASGAVQAYKKVKPRGLNLKDDVVFTTLLHAGLMDVSIAAAVFNWRTKRVKDGYFADEMTFLVSTISLGLLMFSAKMGGKLVYEHGVGVKGRVQKVAVGKKGL